MRHHNLWEPFTKGLLSRMKKMGLTPPVVAFTPYAAEVAKSEGWPHVHQVDYTMKKNFFEMCGELMGQDIVW